MAERIEKKRCAIYTRKSVEEGLEMEFNSLDAQREAAENYIASQRDNGWVCLPQHYDDGGFSGGNTNRPGLQQLLRDAEDGLIDIIVVYKIDRLSRSILDFADLSKKLDRWGVAFVSVTQEINTHSSSGRMMLNILITFAQFEREVIAERVRDKITASKKRGKFCGGVPMLGYKPDPVTKKLFIVEDEAKLVRTIYEKYLLRRSLRDVVREINALGYQTKEWSSAKGNKHESRPWDTGTVYRILTSPIYAGYIAHYDELYEGEHKPIIERETWQRVQSMMGKKEVGKRGRKKSPAANPFAGIIKCGNCGHAMTPTYTQRHGRKYVYYFCQYKAKHPESKCMMRRIPSGDIEKAIVQQLVHIFRTPTILHETLTAVREREKALCESMKNDRTALRSQMDELKKGAMAGQPDFDKLNEIGSRISELERQIRKLEKPTTEDEVIAALGDASGLWEFLIPAARYELLRLIVGGIEVFADKLKLILRVDGLQQLAKEMAVSGYFTAEHEATPSESPETEQRLLPDGGIELTMPLILKTIGGHRNVIIPTGSGLPPRQDAIVRAIQNGREWADRLKKGDAANITDLARKLGFGHPYTMRILGLSTLAPDIVEAICAGREPEGCSLERLGRGFSADWEEQRQELGFI